MLKRTDRRTGLSLYLQGNNARGLSGNEALDAAVGRLKDAEATADERVTRVEFRGAAAMQRPPSAVPCGQCICRRRAWQIEESEAAAIGGGGAAGVCALPR